MSEDPQQNELPPEDSGLRRLMLWVVGALIVTLVVTIVVVELTLRWFGER